MNHKQKLPFKVIHEDDLFIVINKPCNLTTMGAKGELSAYSLLLKYLMQKSKFKPSLYTVHRLDKPTSGTVLFAKDQRAWKIMQDLFKKRKTSKSYKAVVPASVLALFDNGNWSEEDKKFLKLTENGRRLEITLPIFGIKTKSRVDFEKGSPAFTAIKILQSNEKYCLLDIDLKSGRFHQIRCHMSYLGHSVVGDDLYHGENHQYGLFLHAQNLKFTYPLNNKRYDFNSPLPSEFHQLFK